MAPMLLCRPNPEWYIAADMFLNVPWPAWYEPYLQLHARARGAPDALAESGGAGAASILRETAGLFDGACAPLHTNGPPAANLHLTIWACALTTGACHASEGDTIVVHYSL